MDLIATDLTSARILVVVPARLGSRRLKNKMLRKLCDKELILWSYESAVSCARQIGFMEDDFFGGAPPNLPLEPEDSLVDVVVACDHEKIKSCVERAGGRAIITNSGLASGSDRVWAALLDLESGLDNTRYDIVINYQGDLPRCESSVFGAGLAALRESGADIATPIVAIDEQTARREEVVKAIFANPDPPPPPAIAAWHMAKDFTRYFDNCSGDGDDSGLREYHQHIGIYIYRRAALERFVSLPPSRLEQRERLEQLRAVDDKELTIAVFPIADAPIEINLATDIALFEQTLGLSSGIT